ncbi:penicillin-binding protein [uncultured Muribaculum sp.]|uniref:penicillin-binding protein n=1 Tax=uncultured Muribaculum sp. TaxID=1918613 RepID=UPI0025B27B03|nr:penicillin-binding protein [uncultured Muribaculum sp.]
MKKENRTHILLRYLWVIAGIMLIVAGVVYKAFDNTILHAKEWNQKALEELSRVQVIKPERGNILASNGSILATNLTFYNVRIDFRSERFLESQYLLAIDSLADSMARYFPIRDAAGWKKRLKKPLDKPKNKRPRAFKLIGNISYAQYEHLRTFPFLKIKNPNKNGLTREAVMRRVNPYGAMARRSIGGVGIDSVNGETHGISGLERALDTLLYGIPGIAKKIPLTKDIVNWTDVPPTPGYNITTTIDINIQDIVENELNNVLTYCDAEWGVAVLMEVSTGNIRAISNLEKSPSGRNGEYIEGMNRAVLGFEPGSVVKTLSMLIALEDGIVTDVNRVISTGRSFPYAGGRPITDSHSCPSMTVKEVIERSSNIGMAKIITSRYGDHPGQFYSRVKKLGFLDPMNTGIAGERPPRFDSVPDNRGGRIALSRMSYGYTTEIPPIYTLSIYNAIANDGKYVRPRLVSRLTSETTDTVLPVSYIGSGTACSPKNASLLRMMLTNVVWGEHGTGKLLRNDKVRIAGKTGTCYIIENRGYNTSKKRLAFCGFFPADNPKYSCIVLTCHPRQNAFGAASTSGTVLKNIALKMYSRGMLDNNPELRPDPEQPQQPPVMFASTHQRVDYLRQGFNIGHVKHFAPAKASRTVPSLKGCSLRDAINHMESLGIDVTFSGSGYVTSQSIPPGTTPAAGARIHLTLNN